MKIVYKSVTQITPYENNPRVNDKAVEAVAASIKEFGFKQPIVVDSQGVIVAGHTRYKAALSLGMDKVPVLVADDLTDEQVKAYRLADNKTAELAEWDFSALQEELDALDMDMSDFGFFDDDWFDRKEKLGNAHEEGNDAYNAFVDKFKPKKTTDDCYTPDEVYNAVADWVAGEYKVERKNFVRPFYPGGDYRRENYKSTDIVVDNPPFSILAEILKFYSKNKINFFLFAPHLTLFSSSSSAASAIGVGVGIIYENGALVETSFLTNLDDCRFRSAPSLYKAVKEAVEATKEVVELPKYVYPNEVVTASTLDRFSKYEIDYKVGMKSSAHIRALDSQKEKGKAIYGSGYLISEKAAAEKAAAEKAAAEKAAAEKAAATIWELSDREREIVSKLQ